ncbi:MAG TPA: asparagine synthetase B family protein [Polyangiaceae bacterium]|jgi:asparagine synthase (glutamine-hydrolysing)
MGGIAGCIGRDGREATSALARMLLSPHARGRSRRRATTGALVVFGARDADLAEDVERGESLALAGYVRRHGRACNAADLLAAWRHEGTGVLGSLSGEYCLAASVRGRVVVARDAIGARPMYVAELRGGGVGFSTSMFALILAGVGEELDHDTLVGSLVLGYPKSPGTALRSVRQVGPGEVWELAPRRSPRRWYAPREKLDAARSLSVAARDVSRTLEHAVGDALVPGARVAAFLSGGLDSSIVLAQVHRSGAPVEAFTLFFGDTQPGEFRYSKAVAEHLGVRQNVLEVDARSFCAGIERTMTHLEDVLSEAIAVPNFLLAREAARTTDVLFTGEGGDQAFGGTKNAGMFLAHPYASHPASSSLPETYLVLHHNYWNDLPVALAPDALAAFDPRRLLAAVRRTVGQRFPSRGTFLGRVMIANTVLKGGNNILVKAAKVIGAAHDLAVRSPMFDRRLVEHALTIPPWQKMDGTEEKLVLRQAAYDCLPRWIVDRPKRGMSLPLAAWFAADLGVLSRDVLTERAVRERGLLRWDYVEKLLAQAPLGQDLVRPRTVEKLWLALVTELHLQAIDRVARDARVARAGAVSEVHPREAAHG